MQKIIIEDNFIMYQFPSSNEERLGHNIYILLDGKRALAIDTGYEQHFRAVIEDLDNDGISIVKVVPSHFHPDNVDGIFLLKRPKIYGNEFAKKTIAAYYDKEDQSELLPQKVMKNNSIIEFAAFKLRLTSAPGHTDCGIVININDKYLHVGDLYMMTDTNKHVLPYVKWSGVKPHIKSLKEVAKSECTQILLAHGPSPIDSADIREGLSNRRLYLDALRRTYNKCSIEEALADVTEPFEFLKWRKEVE